MVEFVPKLINSWELNPEATAKLQQNEALQLFKQWLNSNGALVNDLEFPAAFGPLGIPGVAAKRTIKPREPLLMIPNKLLITVKKARQSAIRPVLLAHPEFFGTDDDREEGEDEDDSDYYVLAMFIFFEKMQGKKSFWYPYIHSASSDPSLAEWTESQLDELQDLTLKNEAKVNRKALHTIWIAICRIMAMHRDVFDLSKYTEKEWYWSYNFVVSRAFGWGLPCTMLIPFADSLNHSTVNISYDLYAEDASQKLHSKKQISAQGVHDDPNLGTSPTLVIEKSQLRQFDVPSKSSKSKSSVSKTTAASKKPVKTGSSGVKSSTVAKKSSELVKKKTIKKEYNPSSDPSAKKLVVDLKEFDIWRYNFGSSTDEEDNDTESEEEEEEEEEGDNESESTKASENLRAFAEDESKEEEDDEGTDDEDEDWSWWSDDDDSLYYVMRTGVRTTFLKDREVFNCYGRRSNRYLLLWYGFALDQNRYNSSRFKLWMNLKFPKSGGEAENLDVFKSLYDEDQETNQDGDPLEGPSEEELLAAKMSESDLSGGDKQSFVPHFRGLTQEFRLKSSRINDQLFTYFRSQLLYFYKGKDISSIYVSAPCSLPFEIQTLDAIDSLLALLLNNYLTTYEQDEELLTKETDIRKRFAITYRQGNKKILKEHQKMVKMIRYIINKLIAGKDLATAYREMIPGIESNEEEMIANRRKIRKYLYKLHLMTSVRVDN